MRRAAALGLVCVLAAAGLTACSAPIGGAVGVRLDAEGRLVGVFDWCPGEGGTDTVILYLASDGGGVTDEVVRLDRDPGRGARSAEEEVVLLDPAGGWRTGKAPSTLDDDVAYDLRAWNPDGDAVEDFPFRISELRGRSGADTILTKKWDGGDPGSYVPTFHTPEDFTRYADTLCD